MSDQFVDPETIVVGDYVVQVGHRADPAEVARAHGVIPTHVFDLIIWGFSAELTPDQVISLTEDPNVEDVDYDRVPEDRAGVQQNAPWHLDRIDQKSLPLNGTYQWSHGGAGVRIYIVDRGIRATHDDIDNSRFVAGYTANGVDANGHGTSVAAAAGGILSGSAKEATLVDVPRGITIGEGLAALNWVLTNHTGRGVVNISFGWTSPSTAHMNALQSLVDAGLVVCGAVPNEDKLIGESTDWPSSHPNVISVSATTDADARRTNAGYGPRVNILGPGQSLTLPWFEGDSEWSGWSGSSFATPIVAGVAAIILERHPSLTPAQVASWLYANSSTGVTNLGAGTPDRLLYSIPEFPPPAPGPPSGLTVTNIGTSVASLGWQAPTSGGPADEYRVSVQGSGYNSGNAWLSGWSSSLSNPFEFTGLPSNTNFTFRVRARNSGGMSNWATIQDRTSTSALAPIDPYASYVAQSQCVQTAQPGVVSFRSLVLGQNPGTTDLGILRACGVGGLSEHKEGRAWDWGVNAFNSSQKAMADNFLAWLLATDAEGNKHAMARRFGIMYIIWNRRMWRAYRDRDIWNNYTGSNPHTDHVHFSFSWAGAQKQTSYWDLGSPTSPNTPTWQTVPMQILFPVDWGSHPTYEPGWDLWRDGGTRRHRATDIYAPSGTEVYAATDGVIDSWMPGISTSVNVVSGGGYQLRVNTPNGALRYQYAHFGPAQQDAAHLAFAPGIVPGKVVKRGDLLGWVGTSGSTASGPHLHFEIRDLAGLVKDDPYADYSATLGTANAPRYDPYPSLKASESSFEEDPEEPDPVDPDNPEEPVEPAEPEGPVELSGGLLQGLNRISSVFLGSSPVARVYRGDALVFKSDVVTVTASILFVSRDNQSPESLAIRNRLESRGHTLTVLHESELPAFSDPPPGEEEYDLSTGWTRWSEAYTGVDVIVLGDLSDNVGMKYRFPPVGVVSLGSWDRLGMGDVDLSVSGTRITILNQDHPLAGSQSGTITVQSSPTFIPALAGDEPPEVVAIQVTSGGKPVVFAYPEGSDLPGSSRAPAGFATTRHVGVGIHSSAFASSWLLPPAGDLLDAAIEYASRSRYVSPPEMEIPDPQPNPLVASFSFSPSEPKTGFSVTFSGATSTGDIASYTWQDDGPPEDPNAPYPLGTGQSMSFVFQTTGTKRVRLTIESPDGTTDSVMQEIEVTAPSFETNYEWSTNWEDGWSSILWGNQYNVNAQNVSDGVQINFPSGSRWGAGGEARFQSQSPTIPVTDEKWFRQDLFAANNALYHREDNDAKHIRLWGMGSLNGSTNHSNMPGPGVTSIGAFWQGRFSANHSMNSYSYATAHPNYNAGELFPSNGAWLSFYAFVAQANGEVWGTSSAIGDPMGIQLFLIQESDGKLVTIPKNSWFTVVARVRMHTAGQSNGSLKFWVDRHDGQGFRACRAYTDVRFNNGSGVSRTDLFYASPFVFGNDKGVSSNNSPYTWTQLMRRWAVGGADLLHPWSPGVTPPAPAPVASFTLSPSSGVTGENITHDGSSSQNAAEYYWDDAVSLTNPVPLGTWPFPNPTVPTPVRSYATAGTKVPRLTVTNSAGAADSEMKSLAITSPVSTISHGTQLTVNNTGSAAPSQLTPHNGKFTTSRHGQVIENLYINVTATWSLGAALEIRHNNVTVRNCHILMRKNYDNQNPSGNYPSVVSIGRSDLAVSGIRIENCTIDGNRSNHGTSRADSNSGNNGIKAYGPCTITRCRIKSVRQGIQFWRNAFPSHVIETYIYDCWRNSPGVSTTGISYRCHTGSNNSQTKRVERCRLEFGGHTGGWTLSTEDGPAVGFEIHDNYVNGVANAKDGSFAQAGTRMGLQPVNTGNHGVNSRNIRATGNRAGGTFQWHPFMWLNQNWPGTTWSNNRWHGSNALITNTYPNG